MTTAERLVATDEITIGNPDVLAAARLDAFRAVNEGRHRSYERWAEAVLRAREPVELYEQPDGSLLLLDGNHRYLAATILRRMLPAVIYQNARRANPLPDGDVLDLQTFGVDVRPKEEWPYPSIGYGGSYGVVSDPATLRTVQRHVSRERVEELRAEIRKGVNPDALATSASVVGGQVWIWDGHHRLAAHLLEGKPIPIFVWDKGTKIMNAPRFTRKRKSNPAHGARKLPAELLLATLDEQGRHFETGVPVTFRFVRNTEKSPFFGSTFGQDVEPAGRFLLHNENPGDLPRRWESGEVHFESPLVLLFHPEHDAVTNTYDARGWKARLSRAFGGKTGLALSAAIAKAGYDGIVTIGSYRGELDTREIVDLRPALAHPIRRRRNPAPREGVVWFHGTSLGAAETILRDGALSAPKELAAHYGKKSSLRPIEGLVYVTRDPMLALQYADMRGRGKGRSAPVHGAVLEVEVTEPCFPDEDEIGKAVEAIAEPTWTYADDGARRISWSYPEQEQIARLLEETAPRLVAEVLEERGRWTVSKVARVGKKLLRALPPDAIARLAMLSRSVGCSAARVVRAHATDAATLPTARKIFYKGLDDIYKKRERRSAAELERAAALFVLEKTAPLEPLRRANPVPRLRAGQIWREDLSRHENPVRQEGVCQICERKYRLRAGQLVHHGYVRPGTGYIEGDCPGVGYPPYEVSCDLVKRHLDVLRERLVAEKAHLADLEGDRVDVVYRREFRRLEPVRREDPHFASERRDAIVRAGSAIRNTEWLINHYERRVADWIPQAVDTFEEGARQAEERRGVDARKAKRSAAAEEKAEKRRALLEKRMTGFEKKAREVLSSWPPKAKGYVTPEDAVYWEVDTKYGDYLAWAEELGRAPAPLPELASPAVLARYKPLPHLAAIVSYWAGSTRREKV